MKIGVWRSLVSAPALGAGGRRFESYHPDQVWPHRLVVRTSAFHAENRGSIPLGATKYKGFLAELVDALDLGSSVI